MTKTNVKANPSTTHRHDTPNNKTHIIKFRVTETEKMELQCTAKLLHLLRTMPDTAQREVILEIIHKHKEYLASLESALAEDEQTA